MPRQPRRYSLVGAPQVISNKLVPSQREVKAWVDWPLRSLQGQQHITINRPFQKWERLYLFWCRGDWKTWLELAGRSMLPAIEWWSTVFSTRNLSVFLCMSQLGLPIFLKTNSILCFFFNLMSSTWPYVCVLKMHLEKSNI